MTFTKDLEKVIRFIQNCGNCEKKIRENGEVGGKVITLNKMYKIVSLTPFNWRMFGHLMYPSLCKQLENGWIQDRIYMVGIKAFETPVALAVLEWDKFEQVALLRSVFVMKEHRRKGLASTLLKHIYTFCQSHQICNVWAVYYAQRGKIPPIEDWLVHNGFSMPRMEARVYHMDRQIAQAPWLKVENLPKGLQLVPWMEMEDSMRRKLLTDSKQAYPSFISPCKTVAPIEPLNSLALISRTGVEGWSISYRLREDIILYDGLYVDPTFQHSNLPEIMLSEAIRIHLNLIDLIPFGLFAVNRSTPSLLNLARKWIEPYAIKTIEKRSCHLVIKHVYEKIGDR